MLLQSAQKIGAGLSTFGLAGAGIGIGTIFASLIGLVAVLDIRSPLLITALMCLLSMPTVFPVNILYPLLLDIIPNAKSRAASVNGVAKLVGSAVCIESASYV